MTTFANHILRALPREELALLEEDLQRVRLSMAHVLHDLGERVDFVYFPENSVVSLMAVLPDGSGLEVAVIGREGVVGFGAFGWGNQSRWRSIVQAPGDAYAVPVRVFQRALSQSPGLLELLVRSAEDLMGFLAQSGVCNRYHSLTERLSRWLLEMADRVNRDELPLTHEFLAEMLGVHRPSVTVALRRLERAGTIKRSGRGRITIVAREGLLAASCPCYATIRRFD